MDHHRRAVGSPRRKPRRPRRLRRRLAKPLFITLVALLLGAAAVLSTSAIAQTSGQWWRGRPSPSQQGLRAFEVQSLDGSGNNKQHPDWGKAGTNYRRVAPARYADGRNEPVAGPNTRYLSNRVFNDVNQNIFSERQVSQWGFVWGQFLDHTFGLRDDAGTTANIAFNAADPLESFSDTLGVVPFVRSKAAPGTGVTGPRQQINTVSSYIDAWAVYGGTNTRLEWLRAGPVDGNLSNNSASLMLSDGLLPRRDSRGNPAAAPTMAIDGRLLAQPNRAMVAGDMRANENIALTATHTLFAREHNRIVAQLPRWLTEEQKFQIARRVVIAEQQYITYTEFLPSLGVRLAPYRGYNSNVNTALSNEFATVGYRAHSQIHGELEAETEADRYDQATLDALEKEGVEVTRDGEDVSLVVPLNVAFFDPDLVGQIQLGPLLKGIGSESEYRNDEMIDNQLRSVMFQVPVTDNPECLDGPEMPTCFNGVVDLGAIDVERGRDHGMPSYNQLRRAYGLSPKSSFRAITGEATDQFPAGTGIDTPNILDFTQLFDVNGKPVALGSEDASNIATRGVRRTTLAARLKAVYGSVDKVDGFVGMISEPHVPGTEFGELQLAMWRQQFQELRDGDRFFYRDDPGLSTIKSAFNIDFRHTLAQLIAANTDIPLAELNPNVFLAGGEAAAAAAALGTEANSTDANGTDGGTGTPGTSAPPAATVPSTSPTRGRRRHRRP
jgi:hypothetical protein